jgi:hypothetical protein
MNEKNDTNVDRARRHWGAAAPDWVIALAEACDQFGQTVMARKLGYSSPVISATLGNAYAGRMDKIEQKVRGELMHEHVLCPVLGEISKRQCVDEQSRPYAATNAVRVELRRACPRCANQIRRSA